VTNRSLGEIVGFGILAGVVAALIMGVYALVASAWMGQGFFTPLYGIASPLIGGKEMETSMMQGVYFNFGPALLGLIVHLLWGGLYGAIFGLIWSRVGGSGAPAIAAGVVYGLVVMVFMSLVVLPLVGAGGMPAMIGYSFGIEHALFGLVLGLWPSVQPGLFPRASVLRPRNAG
jgi:uncharacterized membrane protein YagU involved in acid resistance